MVYILAGEDTNSSRNKLNELLEDQDNIVRIDAKKQPISDVELALESSSLFSSKKAVVIENYSKVKPADRLAEIISGFVMDRDVLVVLWDVAVPSVKLTKVKGVISLTFVYPKVYFNFLDNLFPKSSPREVVLLQDVLRSYSAEQVLYSIVKRIRQLLVLKSQNYMDFSEFKGMQSWQLGKLQKQSDMWTEEQLGKAFLYYTELDEKIKTSGLTMDLSAHLDILVASDLN